MAVAAEHPDYMLALVEADDPKDPCPRCKKPAGRMVFMFITILKIKGNDTPYPVYAFCYACFEEKTKTMRKICKRYRSNRGAVEE